MENNIKLTGVWYGEHTIEDEHRPELQGKKLKFRLTLEENDGDISGECIDIEGTGVVDVPASVSGFIDEDVISLVKLYPAFYYLNARGEIEKIEDREPPEINYSGSYNAEIDMVEGDWHVIFEVRQLTFGFAEHAISGSWFMKRESW